MKKIVIGLLVAALAVVVPAASSSAGTYSDSRLTLTTQDLALWPGYCGETRSTISGPALSSPHWDLTVTVHDPRGAYVDSAFFSDGDAARSMPTDLCADDDVHGSYRVDAEYTTYDTGSHETGTGTVTGHFTLSTRPRSASAVTRSKSPLGKHRWKVTGVVRIGGQPWQGHAVSLQTYRSGAWHTVATKRSSTTGTVVFNRKPRKGAGKRPMRLHSYGGRFAVDANSPTFRLPKR